MPRFRMPSVRHLGLARDALVGTALVVAAVAHARGLVGYHFEDAFITFRYARNLAEGHGFVFNPGERVLGTSSPLFTLALAFFAWLGVDPVTAGRWLYAGSLSAAGGLGALFLRRLGHPNAGALFALVSVWAVGNAFDYFGLETTFHLALMVATWLAAVRAADDPRHDLVTGVLLGLLCLNRYDGTMVAVVVGFCLWAARGRPPWRVAAITSALFATWLAFAWAYFGAILPNTLDAKAGDSGVLQYVAWTLARQSEKIFSPFAEHRVIPPIALRTLTWGLLLAPLGWKGALWLRRRDSRNLPLALPLGSAALLVAGYAVIGPPERHQWYHLPGLYAVLLAALGAWGWWVSDRRSVPRRATNLLAATAALATLAVLPRVVETRSAYYLESPVIEKVGAYQVFADTIREAGLEDTSILTREPGFLTYQTRQKAIDAAGLVTPGVYFHGPDERETSFRQLLGQYRPDFFVLPLLHSHQEPDLVREYVPMATGAGHYHLFLRHSTLDRHFANLYSAWLERSQDPGRADAEERTPEEQFAAVNGYWHLRGAPLGKVAGRGYAMSREFTIDFDELVFDLEIAPGADLAKTRFELLVDDVVVLALDGRDAGKGRVRRSFPTYPWRGHAGRLRLVDRAEDGSIEASLPTPAVFAERRTIDDFEDGFAPLWKETWADQPASTTELARRFGVHFVQGRGVASTLGLEGEPNLVSQPIVAEADRWIMTVYDFGDAKSGVHLWVDGERVYSWTGTETGRMHTLVWNVAPFRGRELALQVRDGDPDPMRGIAVDSIVAVR